MPLYSFYFISILVLYVVGTYLSFIELIYSTFSLRFDSFQPVSNLLFTGSSP